MNDRDQPKKPGRLARLISQGRLEREASVEREASASRTAGLQRRSEHVERSDDLQRALRRALRVHPSGAALTDDDPQPLDEVVAALQDRPVLTRETTDTGRVTSLTWRQPVSAVHGNRRHDEALDLPTGRIASVLRDERLRDFDAKKALFVDIESTGLSHGAGTYAFLVGLAWFEDAELVVQELFLEDPSDEAAMLARFADLRASRPFLVSFNGRCYDVHVLQSRLVLNRVYDEPESELLLTPHVDLLHLSRPIYNGVFENNRLQTLEREILDVARHGDVPGELIPSLYFGYLGACDTGPLAPVFRHNAVDVLSMVSLLSHMGEVLRRAPSALPAPVAANLGGMWLARKRPNRAAEALAYAAAELPPPDRVPVRERQVLALKRCLDAGGDATLQHELLAALGDWSELEPSSPLPHVELSRVHERRTRRLDMALTHARLALERLPASATDEERDAAGRRITRLERRLTRSS